MPHPLAASFSAIPSCALCLDVLGRWGGPVTLHCGHNACRDCLAPVLARPSPRCPLCRTPVPPELTSVAVNHELRDLVALATMLYLDEREKQDGWEAFPSGEAAALSYKDDVKQHLEQQHNRQQQQLVVWNAGDAGPSSAGLELGPPSAESAVVAARGTAADRDVLALEPPQWLPDSFASACGGCHLQFRPLTRLKHHCRMCGKIFCHSCCHKRLLLPPKFATREPQRVCELCSSLLAPLQPYLAGTQAAAVQPPVHDSIDSVSLRSWLNSPWSSSLEGDIFKGANIVQTFTRAMRLHPEQGLPMAVLQGCRALVLLSSVKVGAGWSCSFGTGLVVSRSPGGGWSAPCAVACCGMGWGLQVGGELADLVLVLRTDEHLRALCKGAQLGFGGDMGLAVGMMGRHADAAVMVGAHGATAPVFSYSCSKGAFIGAALQGSVMLVRSQVNEKFYGYAVSPAQLLLEDAVPQPPAASTLYDALHALAQKYEMRAPLTPAQLQQYTLQRSHHPQLAPPPPPAQQQQQQQATAEAPGAASAAQQPQQLYYPEVPFQQQPIGPYDPRAAAQASELGRVSSGSDDSTQMAAFAPRAMADAGTGGQSGAEAALGGVRAGAVEQPDSSDDEEAEEVEEEEGLSSGGAASGAAAPAPAPAVASAPDWSASGTYATHAPAFLLPQAAPPAPAARSGPAAGCFEAGELAGDQVSLPAVPAGRTAAPQLTSRPRQVASAVQQDDDVAFGFLFDD